MSEETQASLPLPGEDLDGWEWAVVEIMGHRKHAGRIREEERFGAKMLRVDVPQGGTVPPDWKTRWYGGPSIFSITPTDEATVLRLNRTADQPGLLTYGGEAFDEDEASEPYR